MSHLSTFGRRVYPDRALVGNIATQPAPSTPTMADQRSTAALAGLALYFENDVHTDFGLPRQGKRMRRWTRNSR